MDIAKVSLLGLGGVMLGFFLKNVKPEFATLVTMGIGLLILGQLKNSLPIDSSYISTLVKMIGVTYIGQFSAGICKDAGYSSTAGQIELFCKLSVMVLSMPILSALLQTIQEFLA